MIFKINTNKRMIIIYFLLILMFIFHGIDFETKAGLKTVFGKVLVSVFVTLIFKVGNLIIVSKSFIFMRLVCFVKYSWIDSLYVKNQSKIPHLYLKLKILRITLGLPLNIENKEDFLCQVERNSGLAIKNLLRES